MDCSGGDQQPSSLQSICHVRASELYPKATMQVEDSGGGGPTAGEGTQALTLAIPFTPVCGEAVEFLGRTADGILALSNYRLFLQMADGATHNVPLGLVEQVEVKDIFYLHVLCKDARSQRLVFLSNDICLDWLRRLLRAIAPPKSIDQLFAFSFYAWSSEDGGENVIRRLKREPAQSYFRSEVERLQFDVYGAWRITKANEKGDLCSSYPRELLVPSCISDSILECVARFRSYRRVPAVVWRHTGNGAVLARCSQPEVGWLGWRSPEDEDLLKAIAEACACDRGHSAPMLGPATVAADGTVSISGSNMPVQTSVSSSSVGSAAATPLNAAPSLPNGSSFPQANGSSEMLNVDNSGANSSGSSSLRDSLSDEVDLPPQGKKLLIMDARSYTTAVANRARGGGCECPEYYPSCEIQFMNLANIHSIRKSFHSLRTLCASAADQPNWLSLLEGTRWLQHMSGLMRAAVTVAQALDREGRPVVVHCSDGWDRTPQIVALAEVLLDPFYRTIQGFQILCEREWLDFGHKFADRCGHTVGGDDHNERCPVFLQWLDCIHQLLIQFPCYFEFSHAYLVKLVQHTYSNLFGTFLCNSTAERAKLSITERTFSVWQFLQAECFKNHLYLAGDQVLWPSCNVRNLHLWSDLYLGSADRATSTLSAPPVQLTTATTTHSAPGSVTGSSGVPSGDASDQGDVEDGGPSAGLVKTRSYDDIIAACDERDAICPLADQPRRCSDSSINVDLKFVNGAACAGEENEQDRVESSKDLEERTKEEQEQLESEICSAAMGLVLSTIDTSDSTAPSLPPTPPALPSAPALVTVADSESLTLTEPSPLVNGSRDETSDDEDEDTEITVTTEIPQTVDTVDSADSSDTRTELQSMSCHGSIEQGFTESVIRKQVLSEDSPPRALMRRAFAHSVDSLTTLAGQSVDSSTDTLVAPDQLATAASAQLATPTSINNGISSSHSALPSMLQSTSEMLSLMAYQTQTTTAPVISNMPIAPPLPTFPYGANSTVASSMPNGMPDIDITSSNAGDMCRVCANSRRFLADNHRDHSGSSSRYSTPPLHSRTPSGGYPATPATPSEERTLLRPVLPAIRTPLDEVDGLADTQSDVQIRLQQIITEQKARVQELERDLHMTLMALTQQVCHQCSHAPPDRNDDVRSLPESGCSGEPASAGESLPSDVSWEAVEEVPDGNPILWVPDHATSCCMGCNTEFSLVRRRHHCRSCGKIFCSDCSENAVPVPNEQFYEPVRVCSNCYSVLQLEQVDNTQSNSFTRRNGQHNTNTHATTNGHSSDLPADMAESALSTFTHHHPSTNGNSCGFSYAAVASGSTHVDSRHTVSVGVTLSDGKLGTQQTQAQSRKAAAAYV